MEQPTLEQLRSMVQDLRPYAMDVDSFFVPPDNQEEKQYNFSSPEQWKLAFQSLNSRIAKTERVIAGAMRAMYKQNDTLVQLLLFALEQAEKEQEVEELSKLAEEKEKEWSQVVSEAEEGTEHGDIPASS